MSESSPLRQFFLYIINFQSISNKILIAFSLFYDQPALELMVFI